MRGGRAPAWVRRWWQGEAGAAGAVADVALWPAEAVFRAVVAGRNGWYDRAATPGAPIPVISIGNLTVGGTGKTPLTAWLASRLLARGHSPAIVLRGYGSDEVELHRELNPGMMVMVSKRRSQGVEEAAELGADCAVLDDGFQHRALARDFDIVLLAAEQGRGGRALPRGPFREPFAALTRADFVIVTRKTATLGEAHDILESVAALPVDRKAVVRLAPTRLVGLDSGSQQDLAALSGRHVLAVSSIAEPDAFAEQLRGLQADVMTLPFPDHHAFDESDVTQMVRAARGRPVVVTGKDAVKLRGKIPSDVEVWVVEQAVEFESGREALERAVAAVVKGAA